MMIQTLGFNPEFKDQADRLRREGQSLARVTAVNRGTYLVRDEAGERPAELAGRFRYHAENPMDLPCVGDWVLERLRHHGELAIIQNVLPRQSFLRRKSAGSAVGFQMIAANIDVVFIVQSCHVDFNVRRLDRYLAMALDGHVEPVILLTKSDLISADELVAMLGALRQNGITVPLIPLSTLTPGGLDDFKSLLTPGRTYCLIGSSGVGKTSLVNRLSASEAFETNAVSATGEGVHTTSRRQLVVLDQGAMLVDTPGMRELSLLDAEEGIREGFEDIRDLARSCRYADCSHTREPHCAVLKALAEGVLKKERVQSFLKLKAESERQALTYEGKRKRDRSA